MPKTVSSVLGLLAVALVAVSAASCGKSSDSNSPANPPAANGGGSSSLPAAAVAEAKQIFESRCVTCHGPEGRGDGPESKKLTPPPRDYHDKTWQASVDDDYLEKIIKYGGASVGRSPSMPGNPDLIAKPNVVKALREMIRNFGKN